jgi:hypothetical protein
LMPPKLEAYAASTDRAVRTTAASSGGTGEAVTPYSAAAARSGPRS